MGIFRHQAERRTKLEDIDLRSPRPVGEPGTCPSCGGAGYLDRIDVVDETQSEHCRTCGHRWVTEFADLKARI